MVLRIGIVAWWLGAMVAAALAFVICVSGVEHLPCRDLLAQQAQMDERQSARVAKFKSDYPNADPFEVLLASADAGPLDTLARDKIAACQRSESPAFFWVVGAALVVCLWSIAFVLGGSFWRPARLRST